MRRALAALAIAALFAGGALAVALLLALGLEIEKLFPAVSAPWMR